MLDLDNISVIFVTFDSCTLETALKAQTTDLNKISPTLEGEANSTFTYPAHYAFFAGHLPRLVSERYYFESYTNIWRSTLASEHSNETMLTFDTKNIIDYYTNLGFNVRGYGGVSFFDTYKRNNSLPTLFSNFRYFGLKKNPPIDERVPRLASSFPLNNINEILNDININKPFFVFINSIATHIPYDTPDSVLPKDYSNLVSRLYKEHYSKQRHQLNKIPFSKVEVEIFKRRQVEALEWADTKIGLLIDGLPKNRPVLFLACSDHGEEFGEGGRFGHAHYHPTVMKVPLWCGLVNNPSTHNM